MRPSDHNLGYLQQLPPGTQMFTACAPTGLEEYVRDATGYALQDEMGNHYYFVMEFEAEEEFQDFLKSKKLVVAFHSQEGPPIFSVGALGAKTEEGNNPELPNTNGSDLN